MTWGVLLTVMGIVLIFRVPYVMERVVEIEYYASIKWFIRIILYIVALMLIGGGSRKIYDNYKTLTVKDSNE